mmetsp:Transcript_93007/g.277655  ORF Transcript_93007/g.277655 Transcript_93007/m.277655 type:complete len:221 (-) Transcript_93007:75-737(-)
MPTSGRAGSSAAALASPCAMTSRLLACLATCGSFATKPARALPWACRGASPGTLPDPAARCCPPATGRRACRTASSWAARRGPPPSSRASGTAAWGPWGSARRGTRKSRRGAPQTRLVATPCGTCSRPSPPRSGSPTAPRAAGSTGARLPSWGSGPSRSSRAPGWERSCAGSAAVLGHPRGSESACLWPAWVTWNSRLPTPSGRTGTTSCSGCSSAFGSR